MVLFIMAPSITLKQQCSTGHKLWKLSSLRPVRTMQMMSREVPKREWWKKLLQRGNSGNTYQLVGLERLAHLIFINHPVTTLDTLRLWDSGWFNDSGGHGLRINSSSLLLAWHCLKPLSEKAQAHNLETGLHWLRQGFSRRYVPRSSAQDS